MIQISHINTQQEFYFIPFDYDVSNYETHIIDDITKDEIIDNFLKKVTVANERKWFLKLHILLVFYIMLLYSIRLSKSFMYFSKK